MAKENKDILEIIQGIATAMSVSYNGTADELGQPGVSIRESEALERTFNDGFKVAFGGNVLKVIYESETLLKEVHDPKFEELISDRIEQCVSELKKEYKKITRKTLSLKRLDEPVMRVEHMNSQRTWVTAMCLYEITGIPSPNAVDKESGEAKMKKRFDKWVKETEKEGKKGREDQR